MRRFAPFLFAFVVLPSALAQPEGVLRLHSPLSEFLTRQQTLGNLNGAPMDAQPLSGKTAQALLDSLDTRRADLSPDDQALLNRFSGRTPGPNVPWVRDRIDWLYGDGNTFFSTEGDGYRLEFEPTLYLGLGPARQTERDGLSPSVLGYQFSRGVRAGGHLGDHIYFETEVEENQRRSIPFVLDNTDRRTTPRLGVIKLTGDDADVYDHWLVRGSVGYQDRYVEVRLGRDRNHWGPSASSVFLSDYASAYDQLLIRARFWRIDYTSVTARFTNPNHRTDGQKAPNKWGSFHRLGISLPGNVDLELFETVISGPDSINGRSDGFELGYLNPVIFFRAVEADLGSPDNVLLGMGAAWRPVPGIRVYGQLMLDELKFSEIGNSWWANKYAWLLGAHVVDPGGIPNLELRAEYAKLRPYTYSQQTDRLSYTHWGDVLGHPAGPNAEDLTFQVRYRPLQELEAALNVVWTHRGRNTDDQNFGSDPDESYNTRISDHNIEFFQGVDQKTLLIEGRVGWEVLPDLWLEGALVGQTIRDELDGDYNALTALTQIRWGIPFRSERF